MKKLLIISILFASCRTTYVWEAQRAVVYNKTVNQAGDVDFKLCAIGKPVRVVDSMVPCDSIWILSKRRIQK